VAASLFAGLSLAACSLLVDTAGLVGGANASDGSVDAALPDAPATADAGADAARDAPAEAAKCVDGPTRFCDDFDQPAPGSKWTDTNKQRGEVTFDDVGLSLPRAMHARITGGNGDAKAELVKEYADPSAHCELDMKLDRVAPTGETDVLAVLTTFAGGGFHIVYFASFGGVWNLAEYQPAGDGGAELDRAKPLGAALPDATWFHVAFDVKPTTASVTANGTTVVLGALSPPASATGRSLRVGIVYASGGVPSGGVLIDNVDCTSP